MNKQEGISTLGSGGFHQTWLIFVEMVASGLFVTIGLQYGLVLSFFIVIVPTYVLLKKIAKDPMQAKVTARILFSKLTTLPSNIALRLRNPKSHTKSIVSLAQ